MLQEAINSASIFFGQYLFYILICIFTDATYNKFYLLTKAMSDLMVKNVFHKLESNQWWFGFNLALNYKKM